jgi:phosphoglycerol transferase MdoB-like AlkP superfamily enzyme
MKAASLFVVLALVKAAALWGHTIPPSWWSPVAYLWQDAAIALAFAAAEPILSSRPRLLWTIYAVLTLYAAMTVPVVRVLSSPLTWAMWRAARGPLADSIWYYATPASIAAVLLLVVAAGIVPLLVHRIPSRFVVGPLMACVALGPAAAARVDTIGLERNAWTALVSTAMPHLPALTSHDWQRSGFAPAANDNLDAFRAVAAGRNIVMVSLESTAAQYLGLYGAQPDVMPNLTRLAASGIVFDRAYAAYPESIKGLYSVLCSAYPAFDVAVDSYEAAPCRSLPAALSEHGYATALFHSGRFMYLGMEAVIRHRGYDTLADAGDIGGNRNSSFGVDEPSTVRRMLQWIDTQDNGRRFFLTYLPIAGHHPYESPEAGPFDEHDEFGRYRNALHEGDAALGTLMRGLQQRGLAERTVWIVFGDHGEAFGQHEGNYGHTFNLYDENVRVPLLVATPERGSAQHRSHRVVSLVDIAPTVLDLAGLAVPPIYQGQSMLGPAARMAFFFADYSRGLLGLRDGSLKVIYAIDSGRSSLFDLEADPLERINVADRYPDRVGWYVQNLKGWSAAQKQRLARAKPPA